MNLMYFKKYNVEIVGISVVKTSNGQQPFKLPFTSITKKH